MTIYAEHTRACLDKYPEGQEYVPIEQAVQQLAAREGLSGKLGASATGKLRAAFVVQKLWDPKIHPNINICFLDGTQKQRDWVQKVVMEKLAPHVDKLNFVWNAPQDKSDVRISFALPNQAWSMIGTDSLTIPKNQPSMNLGWIDDDVQYDAIQYKNTGQVVIHEFGHMLGMIHEHQSPFGEGIKWNKPVVYSELAKTNGWSKAVTDNNMFKKYGDFSMCQTAVKENKSKEDIRRYCTGDLVNGSQYDPKSIMHYFFPSKWTLDGRKIPVNTELSPMDIQWLQKFYKKGGVGQPAAIPEIAISGGSWIYVLIVLLLYISTFAFIERRSQL